MVDDHRSPPLPRRFKITLPVEEDEEEYEEEPPPPPPRRLEELSKKTPRWIRSFFSGGGEEEEEEEEEEEGTDTSGSGFGRAGGSTLALGSGAILRSGYLEKKNQYHQYQRRYWVLRTDALQYHREAPTMDTIMPGTKQLKQKPSPVCGDIPLAAVGEVARDERNLTVRLLGADGYCFRLRAQDELEAQEWLQAVTAARDGDGETTVTATTATAASTTTFSVDAPGGGRGDTDLNNGYKWWKNSHANSHAQRRPSGITAVALDLVESVGSLSRPGSRRGSDNSTCADDSSNARDNRADSWGIPELSFLKWHFPSIRSLTSERGGGAEKAPEEPLPATTPLTHDQVSAAFHAGMALLRTSPEARFLSEALLSAVGMEEDPRDKKKISVALAAWLCAEADSPGSTKQRRSGALEWLDICAHRELAFGFGTMQEGSPASPSKKIGSPPLQKSASDPVPQRGPLTPPPSGRCLAFRKDRVENMVLSGVLRLCSRKHRFLAKSLGRTVRLVARHPHKWSHIDRNIREVQDKLSSCERPRGDRDIGGDDSSSADDSCDDGLGPDDHRRLLFESIERQRASFTESAGGGDEGGSGEEDEQRATWESVAEDVVRLERGCNALIESLSAGVETCPPMIRWLCRSVHGHALDCLSQRSSDFMVTTFDGRLGVNEDGLRSVVRPVMSGFLFLRCICPSLTSPRDWGVDAAALRDDRQVTKDAGPALAVPAVVATERDSEEDGDGREHEKRTENLFHAALEERSSRNLDPERQAHAAAIVFTLHSLDGHWEDIRDEWPGSREQLAELEATMMECCNVVPLEQAGGILGEFMRRTGDPVPELEHHCAHRALVSSARVMQRVANGGTKARDPFFGQFDDFVAQAVQRVDAFYTQMASSSVELQRWAVGADLKESASLRLSDTIRQQQQRTEQRQKNTARRKSKISSRRRSLKLPAIVVSASVLIEPETVPPQEQRLPTQAAGSSPTVQPRVPTMFRNRRSGSASNLTQGGLISASAESAVSVPTHTRRPQKICEITCNSEHLAGWLMSEIIRNCLDGDDSGVTILRLQVCVPSKDDNAAEAVRDQDDGDNWRTLDLGLSLAEQRIPTSGALVRAVLQEEPLHERRTL